MCYQASGRFLAGQAFLQHFHEIYDLRRLARLDISFYDILTMGQFTFDEFR